MVFAISFSSCEKEELYSCDKEINSWVKDNINDIKIMTRSAWIELPENFKGPAFGAFNPDQKSLFWNERMKEILTLEWNEKEKDHLIMLHHAILNNNKWFDTENRTESINEEMLLFAFKWIDYAKEELKLNEKLIFSIVGSGNKMIDKSGEIYVVNKNMNPRLKNGSERSCNCNQTYDFCSGVEPDCLDKDCDTKPFCGWLLLSQCNGLCGM